MTDLNPKHFETSYGPWRLEVDSVNGEQLEFFVEATSTERWSAARISFEQARDLVDFLVPIVYG